MSSFELLFCCVMYNNIAFIYIIWMCRNNDQPVRACGFFSPSTIFFIHFIRQVMSKFFFFYNSLVQYLYSNAVVVSFIFLYFLWKRFVTVLEKRITNVENSKRNFSFKIGCSQIALLHYISFKDNDLFTRYWPYSLCTHFIQMYLNVSIAMSLNLFDIQKKKKMYFSLLEDWIYFKY